MLCAVLVLWFGCLLTFTASPHQKFIAIPLNRRGAWSVFSLLVVVSWWLMSLSYSGVVSALIVLSLMMAMWQIIVFCHAHWFKKIVPLSCYGGLFFIGLTLLGGV